MFTKYGLFRIHGNQLLIIGAILALFGAGIYGQLNKGTSGYDAFLPGAMPKAASFTTLKTSAGATIYEAKDGAGIPIGYVTGAQGPGYGGPMSVLVGWTLDGKITSVTIPQHHEDMPWWRALIRNKYFSQYIGRIYTEPLQLSSDIDAISGSTVSSNGVAVGVRAGRLLVAEQLGKPYTAPPEPINIGLAEIMVAFGLLMVVLARALPSLRHKSWPRFASLIYSFVIIGIWLSIPLSLTNIASWLVGYSPHMQTFFVIYIIVFGVIGLAAVLGKNYYCFWLCPYVAVQEGLHFIFGINFHPSPKWLKVLHSTRWILLFIAVFLVLLFKNPSVSVFEPWNVLFSLKGTADQWVLMIFAIVSSIFVYNFWCHYLCPVGAVLKIVLKLRKGAINLWHKRKTVLKPAVLPISS
jgi:NosR/NirI family transcriptional regulator, nitrous oxide reductase regulator